MITWHFSFHIQILKTLSGGQHFFQFFFFLFFQKTLGGHPIFISGFFQLFKINHAFQGKRSSLCDVEKEHCGAWSFFFTSQQIDDNCVIVNL